MKKADNSSVTASPRGGVGSNVMRIQSASVPNRDKQAEEGVWQRCGTERGVWSEPMLIAIEGGVKGNKWFSCSDKKWLQIKYKNNYIELA